MKTFEEKFTAWIDGELKGEELAKFEVELAQVKDAEIDRLAARQIGDLFREHGKAPELRNADFFNHQLMQRIEAETPRPQSKPERARFSWKLSSLAMTGAIGMVAALFMFYFTMQTPQPAARPGSSQIISMRSGDPDIVASAFHSQENNVTVLWLDNLNYMQDKRPHVKKSPQPQKEQSPAKPSNH